jgi:hypothetical protein
VALDNQANLYIAEEYAGIRKVSQDGTITTAAGGGKDWNIGGECLQTVILLPIAVAVDGACNP